MVSHVEHGAGRALFIGNQSHLAPLQIRAMQTSGTKAKSQKKLQHIVGNTIGTSLKMYAHLSVCHRALKTRSAREFVATGALAFQRISRPFVWLRKRFLDEQKAADKGKKIVPSSFSTEHHGAWSS